MAFAFPYDIYKTGRKCFKPACGTARSAGLFEDCALVAASRFGTPESLKEMLKMAAAKLTQSALVKELATATGVSTKVAKHLTTVFVDIILKEVKKNGVSIVPGIGKLVRVERKARMGRNPATGAAIKIPAKKVVKFRIAKAVKDAIVPPKKK
jgi:DNA-binding protein HU-beta